MYNLVRTDQLLLLELSPAEIASRRRRLTPPRNTDEKPTMNTRATVIENFVAFGV
jgi:hypothetical protein